MNRIKISIGLLLFFLFSQAYAVLILDQNQTVALGSVAMNKNNLAQSFQQSANNIAGAGVLISAGIGVSDTVTISLYDNLPNAGGNLLASGSGVATAGNWFDVTFNTVVGVAPATTMYLVFTSVASTLSMDMATNDPYALGMLYSKSFMPITPYDFTFRTYSDSAFVAGVPAPGSLALLALGLVGMIALRRKSLV